MSKYSWSFSILVYAVTIFTSAFLLFQVQPLVARAILPWFGGTAAVWTTCMMFFQLTLLLGYAYAHCLRILFSPHRAWLLHSILLGVAACFADILPRDDWQPAGAAELTTSILKVLITSVGLPFFVLSTTGPLVQVWQSQTHPSRSPYRLYALSNLGSMLALISYPFVFERFFSLADQGSYWRIGFLFFCGLACWSAWQASRGAHWNIGSEEPEPPASASPNPTKSEAAFEAVPARIAPAPLPRLQVLLVWIALAMGASIMLLATTNLMCQEVAAVPFLWILPLSLYLLSFIICFDQPVLYRRWIFLTLLSIAAIASIVIVHLNVWAGFSLQLGSLATVCFAASMTCHGELERLKPATKQLTWFYLMISLGGSLGGIFVTVIAPRIFDWFCEFQVGLLICLLVPLVIVIQEAKFQTNRIWQNAGRWLVCSAVVLSATFVACSLMFHLDSSLQEGLVYRARNEYGLVSVVDRGDYRMFINGRIEHGREAIGSNDPVDIRGYYQKDSGVSLAIQCFRHQLTSRPAEPADKGIHVGVLGLGAGSMMTWAEKNDRFEFFELNPQVQYIAENFFTFLAKAVTQPSVVIGDGRLQLERRAARIEEKSGGKHPEKFDVLVIDAFSSDSIPLHLLTDECFFVYLRNLNPNGVLVAHITNRFVDLRPVIYQQALDHSLTPILIETNSGEEKFRTRWILMTTNPAIVHSQLMHDHRQPWPSDMRPLRWTDDHASIAEVLDWSGEIDWTNIQKLISENKNKIEKSKPATSE